MAKQELGRCVASVHGYGGRSHQCIRNAKVVREGIDELGRPEQGAQSVFCGIHDPIRLKVADAKREAARNAEWSTKLTKMNREQALRGAKAEVIRLAREVFNRESQTMDQALARAIIDLDQLEAIK